MDDPTDAYEPLTEIEVAESLDVSDIDLTLVKGWVHQMADHELMVKLRKDILGDLCIRFCDEAESQATNQQFRKKDKPTNVLSFPADLYVPDIHLLGDLLICIPVVRAEAAAQGKSVQNHLHHLIIHGVLHLLGYDHEVELEAQRMEAVEVALLAAAGVPDPYFLAPHHTSD